jgi:hypothetical protein
VPVIPVQQAVAQAFIINLRQRHGHVMSSLTPWANIQLRFRSDHL